VQDFIKTVLAYEAIVLLGTPESDLTCLPLEQVQDIWQLGGSKRRPGSILVLRHRIRRSHFTVLTIRAELFAVQQPRSGR
jgi:hypothetical protein